MKARPDYMPPEQFRLILNTIPELNLRKYQVEDVQMFMKICYWLALRVNEALDLVVEHFDFEINEVWLGQTKTDKSATAPIPLPFKSELREYLSGKSGLLFPGWKYITILKWLEKLGKILNIPAWITSQE